MEDCACPPFIFNPGQSRLSCNLQIILLTAPAIRLDETGALRMLSANAIVYARPNLDRQSLGPGDTVDPIEICPKQHMKLPQVQLMCECMKMLCVGLKLCTVLSPITLFMRILSENKACDALNAAQRLRNHITPRQPEVFAPLQNRWLYPIKQRL